ncbi:MAG: hypothetical protein GF334_00070, partial [Candidatus Altiarchaeales archaeon]|nr:hypothetical protein [Candidatus Altiarchaeales archaeon]
MVGPTLKDHNCTWQWEAIDNSSLRTGDQLRIDLDISGAAGPTSFSEAYKTSSVKDEGLYLFVSALGGDDGLIYDIPPRTAVTDTYENLSKFEVFRVIDITGKIVTLDPNKRLANYFGFTGGATNIIRAVTFIKPYVTRLAALPSGSSPGAEKSFVVISPETSANSDLYPAYDYGSDSWIGLGGDSNTYGSRPALPIPYPTKTENGDSFLTGSLDSVTRGGPVTTGYSRITNISLPVGTSFDPADLGKIIHITKVVKPDGVSYLGGTTQNVLGWYEIKDADYTATDGVNNYLLLRRIPEVNPSTGEKFFGPGPYTQDPDITVEFTIHNPVSSLFTSSYLDLDALDTCRLTNLIDPDWVQRSSKRSGTGNEEFGLSWNRADRAIFDTYSDNGTNGSDPGSLLDLGFRMVLYPGKDFGGVVVPDLDKPIDTREVVLDPSITDEEQYIEVDYSGGIVRLSHPAVSGSDVAPNGFITGTNNPDGRLALFASCVPYSMEKSQLGSGVRVTGGDLSVATAGSEQIVQTDVYSSKTIFSVAATHSVTAGGNVALTVEDTDNLLPPTGVVRLIEDASDPYGTSYGDYGYHTKSTAVVAPYGTVTTLEGIYPLPGATALPVTVTNGISVLRRQPEVEYSADSTYGAAARTTSFRFAYADLTSSPDGSVVVTPTAIAGAAEELRAASPFGSSSEIGRVHLDSTTQNWTVGGPPHVASGDNEIGFELIRGKVYTSMTHDFADQVWDFKPFLNRGISVAPSNAAAVDGSLRTNSYTLEIHGSGISDLPTGFLDYVPEDEFNSGNLCVRVEGSTIATSEESTWGGGFGLSTGDRVLVNVKKFGDRTTRDANAHELHVHDEGPSNPIHWAAYTAAGSDTVTDLVSGINSTYTTLQGCSPAEDYDSDRVFLTGRQISV